MKLLLHAWILRWTDIKGEMCKKRCYEETINNDKNIRTAENSFVWVKKRSLGIIISFWIEQIICCLTCCCLQQY